jgi:hypothetical protein
MPSHGFANRLMNSIFRCLKPRIGYLWVRLFVAIRWPTGCMSAMAGPPAERSSPARNSGGNTLRLPVTIAGRRRRGHGQGERHQGAPGLRAWSPGATTCDDLRYDDFGCYDATIYLYRKKRS